MFQGPGYKGHIKIKTIVWLEINCGFMRKNYSMTSTDSPIINIIKVFSNEKFFISSVLSGQQKNIALQGTISTK